MTQTVKSKFGERHEEVWTVPRAVVCSMSWWLVEVFLLGNKVTVLSEMQGMSQDGWGEGAAEKQGQGTQ